jgi:hypothetical protein
MPSEVMSFSVPDLKTKKKFKKHSQLRGASNFSAYINSLIWRDINENKEFK